MRSWWHMRGKKLVAYEGSLIRKEAGSDVSIATANYTRSAITIKQTNRAITEMDKKPKVKKECVN